MKLNFTLSVIKGLEIGKLPSSVRVSPLTPHPAKKNDTTSIELVCNSCRECVYVYGVHVRVCLVYKGAKYLALVKLFLGSNRRETSSVSFGGENKYRSVCGGSFLF